MKGYFHLCSDGKLTRRFISSESDYYAAFNLTGVCAAQTDVSVLAFSIGESHPHQLIYADLAEAKRFMNLYERSYTRHIVVDRKGLDGVEFKMELFPVDSQDYLKTVGTYVISQPTKDGKSVMPYDYRWGTGSMYFRPDGHVSIWRYDNQGNKLPTIPVGDLAIRTRMALLHSKRPVPSHWLTCNGLLLPENYVDVRHFENIYRTHNSFRAFLSTGRSKDMEVLSAIAASRGIALDDREAGEICRMTCQELFGFSDTRKLIPEQRLSMARELRQSHHLSLRQIATLTRLPEEEVARYIR